MGFSRFHVAACDYSLGALLFSITLLHSMVRCYVIILHYPLISINSFPLIRCYVVAVSVTLPITQYFSLPSLWFVIVRLSLSITVRHSSFRKMHGDADYSVLRFKWTCVVAEIKMDIRKHSTGSGIPVRRYPFRGGMIDYYKLFSISLMRRRYCC